MSEDLKKYRKNNGVIYIAGKVTGEDVKTCKEKFSKAEYFLRRKGYDTVNPLRIVNPSSNWQSAMKACIKELIDCDQIYMLSDWKKSRGAKLELKIAEEIGLKVTYQEDQYVV